MDVWDLVRDLGDDAELDDDALRAAERTLRYAIDGETARKRRLRWALGGGIGAAVLTGAAATAVALSMTNSTAPVVQPDPDAGVVETPVVTVEPAPDPTPTPAAPTAPTAQEVLEGAAALAVESAGSVMAEGRYLRIEHTIAQLVLYAPDAPASPYNANRESATAAWVSTGTWVQYIPSERSGEWVRVFEPEHEIAARFGAATDQLIAEWDQKSGVDEQIVQRVQGGIVESYEGEPTLGSDAYYAQMPQDPAALLEWNRQRVGASEGTAVDAAVVIVLIQDLELNAAPPALRAAMFRALALVPGAEIVAADQATSTIAYTYPGDRREMLTIDTATGLVTSRSTTLGAGVGVVPGSVPDFTYRTTISVVDEAP
ncbi:hypothetical protein MK786_03500 [Microbacterium sp. CFH 31415]|uniref:hypothetical protein n=1 Tax=Microbacterium sp. CFH 31415 TaxID=2921732 RepID=UPI001F12C945|nr:hypothetical protein [Microbacterium sp. CFH 31415]MCH6229798.1 hypothetical protein [Microbacterium sp. CFH 31415]